VFALGLGVEFLALSFVRRAEDIRELKQLMQGQSGSAQIVAKIERPEALENIGEILQEVDAIMVARGDLGVELPPEYVPVAQTQLLDQARAQRKPAIVATQMLESMMDNPRPTRAEVTDVAHSVTSGADAVMLSGETAAGDHPQAAVEMMNKVARQTEGYMWQHGQFDSLHQEVETAPPLEFGQALGRATASLSRDLMARAIFVVARHGRSAAEVCSARPAAPVIVLAASEERRRSLNLLWGAIPVAVSEDTLDDPVPTLRKLAVSMGLAEPGQGVLLVRGFNVEPERNLPAVTLIRV
jgi:pyruvate kinase